MKKRASRLSMPGTTTGLRPSAPRATAATLCGGSSRAAADCGGSGGTLDHLGTNRVMLIGDAAGMVSPVTGGGIHTALNFGRRAAQLVSDFLGDRGPHPVGALRREAPRYRVKRALRRLLDTAPSNALINAFLMTSPMKALAQRMYFHSRSGSAESFEAWSKEFEEGDLQQSPPQLPGPKLRLI
jgi:flavin-dependent dehydrogenase